MLNRANEPAYIHFGIFGEGRTETGEINRKNRSPLELSCQLIELRVPRRFVSTWNLSEASTTVTCVTWDCWRCYLIKWPISAGFFCHRPKSIAMMGYFSKTKLFNRREPSLINQFTSSSCGLHVSSSLQNRIASEACLPRDIVTIWWRNPLIDLLLLLYFTSSSYFSFCCCCCVVTTLQIRCEIIWHRRLACHAT